MTPDPSAIDHRLTLLKTRFADRAADQLGTLLRELQGEQDTGFSHGSLETLYQLLHRLAGSAGTFGFIELGHQASVLEQRIKPLLEEPGCSAAHGRRIVDNDVIEQLHRLAGMLQQGRELHVSPAPIPRRAATSDTQATELLVLGEALTELAEALLHYGFNVRHCPHPGDMSEQYWHEGTIIVVQARHLEVISEWNQAHARRLQQKAAPSSVSTQMRTLPPVTVWQSSAPAGFSTCRSMCPAW